MRYRRNLVACCFCVFASVACHSTTTIEPFGDVSRKELCADPNRCNVQGAEVVSLWDRGSSRVLVPDEANFIGMRFEHRDMYSTPDSCGRPVWCPVRPTRPSLPGEPLACAYEMAARFHRDVQVNASKKRKIGVDLAADIVEALSGTTSGDELQANVEAGVQSFFSLDENRAMRLDVEVYRLTEAGFLMRAKQCGVENDREIVYSASIVTLSGESTAEYSRRLAAHLRGAVEMPDVARAQLEVAVERAVRTTIQSEVEGHRFAAVVGFNGLTASQRERAEHMQDPCSPPAGMDADVLRWDHNTCSWGQFRYAIPDRPIAHGSAETPVANVSLGSPRRVAVRIVEGSFGVETSGGPNRGETASFVVAAEDQVLTEVNVATQRVLAGESLYGGQAAIVDVADSSLQIRVRPGAFPTVVCEKHACENCTATASTCQLRGLVIQVQDLGPIDP